MRRYLPELSEANVRWTRFFGLILAVVALIWLAQRLRSVLTPMAVALAVAYILNPLVTRLERRGFRRLSIIGVIYVVGFGLLAGGLVLLGAAAVAQFSQLAENVPRYLEGGFGWLNQNYPGLSARLGDEEKITGLLEEHGAAAAGSVLAYARGVFSNVTYWLSTAVLIPLYAFFFLWRFDALVTTVRDHLPAASRPTIVHIVGMIDRATAEFFRGRLIICLAVGILTALGWLIAGVPYSLPLGAAVGVLNLVPFLPLLVLPPALVLSWLEATQAGANWLWPVVATMAVFMIVQGLESFVFTPYVESKSSGLHPVTTVVSLLIGGQLLGLLGMLLSIPIASTLKSLGGEYLLPEVRRLAAEPDTAQNDRSPPADEKNRAPTTDNA
ncbi:MAG: AI-2E family transporter [Planctomycetes bacterium]|nr:AI-2E family transporter [Planctomycetota bacterium]